MPSFQCAMQPSLLRSFDVFLFKIECCAAACAMGFLHGSSCDCTGGVGSPIPMLPSQACASCASGAIPLWPWVAGSAKIANRSPINYSSFLPFRTGI
ncbi:hypothetical protein K461DRAFT_34568 [Myriangium duriaei CBS 260.36]|uniref:Uncharacterized protein n=1 Tax=Myriangium duriaei CBS 260.36 TaxID=1168546 RepID=A0A9P4ITQ4_9PEZI|nr:hypothetical protein K461DRAFT_34568 [Myriangium duriaei CBS 260.36]